MLNMNLWQGSTGEKKSPSSATKAEEKETAPSPGQGKSNLKSPKGSGKGKKSSPPERPPSPPSPHDGSYTETFDSNTASKDTGENVKSLGEEVREKAQAEAGKCPTLCIYQVVLQLYTLIFPGWVQRG